MILIIGGAYQGKLTWAAAQYGLTSHDVWDLAQADAVPGRRCYFHLEALTKRCREPERYLHDFKDAVVIAREIGSGVVPVDAEERCWRERHGAFLKQLAAQADCVVRIFCGIAEVLK